MIKSELKKKNFKLIYIYFFKKTLNKEINKKNYSKFYCNIIIIPIRVINILCHTNKFK